MHPKWAELPVPGADRELMEPAAVAVLFDASASPSALTDVGTVEGYAALAEEIAKRSDGG